ncbi:MAG TPA: S9 family peptidase [Usitatibacter sp.]|nr:S9 family peptidase [Usitatibacter sp.]
MNRIRTRIVLVLASIALAGSFAPAHVFADATAPKKFPVRDFFANPERAYFRLSDDGKTLGFMQPVAEAPGQQRRLNVFVQPLEGSTPVGEARQLTHETARDINIYYWKGSDRILYTKDFGGDENFHVVAVDVKTAKITDLTPFDKVRAEIVDDLPDDPFHVLIQHNKRNPEVFDVFRVDVRTGESVLVAENPGDILGWQTDHHGRVLMAARTKGLDTELLYRPSEKAEFKTIATTDYKTRLDPAFFTDDEQKVYMISNRGRDKTALVMMDPNKPQAEAEEVLYQDPDVDVDGPSWSNARRRLTMVTYAREKTVRKFFDPYYEKVFADIEKKLPGMEITLQNSTKPEDKFIVAAGNDRTPGARYIYDAKADTLTKLGDINTKIPEDAMSFMKPINYTARDGLAIHGYLTLPLGREPKNLACVVNPHGGPWARDTWGYNPEVQFLANRGYCVLQMNFRSSTGYGRKFWEAGFGQWGLKMQDDITDGVKWLIAQGIADPKRVGIYGGSYGGYATLAGVTFTPDLYAAAVDYVGVANMFTFMKTIPPYWKPLMPKFYEMVGDPVKDKARLEATSPVMHADRIKTPLFVAQGARDPRVNKDESDQMVAALKKRGVAVEYMVKDNEGHGFRNEENQFAFYEAMEKFLAAHMAP